MKRREAILGVAMLANVGRASAQGRARRIGALISEPFAGDVLEASALASIESRSTEKMPVKRTCLCDQNCNARFRRAPFDRAATCE